MTSPPPPPSKLTSFKREQGSPHWIKLNYTVKTKIPSFRVDPLIKHVYVLQKYLVDPSSRAKSQTLYTQNQCDFTRTRVTTGGKVPHPFPRELNSKWCSLERLQFWRKMWTIQASNTPKPISFFTQIHFIVKSMASKYPQLLQLINRGGEKDKRT